MRYKRLGPSGLRVSELCLGTMTFGTAWGWGGDLDACRAMFDAFVEAGGNFIDTANKYTDGESERIVGELIGPDRDRFVVGTKYTLATRDDDLNAAGNHKKNLRRAVESSLKRLATDYVDLLWVHAWDFTVQPQELMRALDDVVRQGKVLHVAVSDTPAWVVARCNTVAELRGQTPFTAVQMEYSLIERTGERELTPMATALDLPVLAWAPLGGGLLTGKYTTAERDGTAVDAARANNYRVTERNLAIARAVDAVAEATGKPATQVALNWVRAHGAIPIVGARTAAQLQESLGAVDWTLAAEHLETLDTASGIKLGFPHDFLSWGYVANQVLGPQRKRLDR